MNRNVRCARPDNRLAAALLTLKPCAHSRVRPEIPNVLAAAEHFLMAKLEQIEAKAITAEFDVQAIVLVLRELYRLQRQFEAVQQAVERDTD